MKQEALRYSIIVTDREGKVIKRLSGRSKSYVKAWNQILNALAASASKTIQDTGGVSRSAGNATAWHLTCPAGAGVTSTGVRLGTGSTAVAITDYALETPIAHGVAAGQLNHLAQEYTEPAVAGSTCSFTIKRVFINNSGGTVSGVRELGLYFRFASATYYAMGFRDVLGGGVDVPDGGAITVEYTLGATV
ncbi:hypothetical protein ES703_18965 [subsurface metagenome]